MATVVLTATAADLRPGDRLADHAATVTAVSVTERNGRPVAWVTATADDGRPFSYGYPTGYTHAVIRPVPDPVDRLTEDRARAAKAEKLAAVLAAHGATPDQAAALPARSWRTIANLAGCRVPSETTRGVVVDLLRVRANQPTTNAQGANR